MGFKNKGVAFIVGAVAGSVVGSVTALLFAPKSGKELRGDIKAGTEKVIEASSEAIDHVSETVYEVSKKLEDGTVKAVQSAKQGVQNVVSTVKQRCKPESIEQHDDNSQGESLQQEQQVAANDADGITVQQAELIEQAELESLSESKQTLHN